MCFNANRAFLFYFWLPLSFRFSSGWNLSLQIWVAAEIHWEGTRSRFLHFLVICKYRKWSYCLTALYNVVACRQRWRWPHHKFCNFFWTPEASHCIIIKSCLSRMAVVYHDNVVFHYWLQCMCIARSWKLPASSFIITCYTIPRVNFFSSRLLLWQALANILQERF